MLAVMATCLHWIAALDLCHWHWPMAAIVPAAATRATVSIPMVMATRPDQTAARPTGAPSPTASPSSTLVMLRTSAPELDKANAWDLPDRPCQPALAKLARPTAPEAATHTRVTESHRASPQGEASERHPPAQALPGTPGAPSSQAPQRKAKAATALRPRMCQNKRRAPSGQTKTNEPVPLHLGHPEPPNALRGPTGPPKGPPKAPESSPNKGPADDPSCQSKVVSTHGPLGPPT